jgi:hypothetical protein
MNKLTVIAIINRSAKNTATVHMLTVGGNAKKVAEIVNNMNKMIIFVQ